MTKRYQELKASLEVLGKAKAGGPYTNAGHQLVRDGLATWRGNTSWLMATHRVR